MDTLRGDEDREINHHGTVRKVGDEVDGVDEVRAFSHSDLRHRDEKKELEARKEFYEHMKQKKRNEDRRIRRQDRDRDRKIEEIEER